MEYDERANNDAARRFAKQRNTHADGVVAGVNCLVLAATRLDSLAPYRPEFSRILAEKAKANGLDATGSLARAILSTLAETAEALRTQAQVPKLIANRPKTKEAVFDETVSGVLSSLFHNRMELARLVSGLRDRLGMPAAKPETIAQRIRNHALRQRHAREAQTKHPGQSGTIN